MVATRCHLKKIMKVYQSQMWLHLIPNSSSSSHLPQNKNKLHNKMSRAKKSKTKPKFPLVVVHSANPIGSANIMGYINNFLMNEAQQQDCVRVTIEHTV
jgi:hypothetical protein